LAFFHILAILPSIVLSPLLKNNFLPKHHYIIGFKKAFLCLWTCRTFMLLADWLGGRNAAKIGPFIWANTVSFFSGAVLFFATKNCTAKWA